MDEIIEECGCKTIGWYDHKGLLAELDLDRDIQIRSCHLQQQQIK